MCRGRHRQTSLACEITSSGQTTRSVWSGGVRKSVHLQQK
jgi:hypothetical protein